VIWRAFFWSGNLQVIRYAPGSWEADLKEAAKLAA
jgi:hypothetical protein